MLQVCVHLFLIITILKNEIVNMMFVYFEKIKFHRANINWIKCMDGEVSS